MKTDKPYNHVYLKSNKYGLDVQVNRVAHPRGGFWDIKIEGVYVGSCPTEEEAWDWVNNTWSKTPGETSAVVFSTIEKEMNEFAVIVSSGKFEDFELEMARTCQRIADLANAGLRVALLARGAK